MLLPRLKLQQKHQRERGAWFSRFWAIDVCELDLGDVHNSRKQEVDFAPPGGVVLVPQDFIARARFFGGNEVERMVGLNNPLLQVFLIPPPPETQDIDILNTVSVNESHQKRVATPDITDTPLEFGRSRRAYKPLHRRNTQRRQSDRAP